jgi:protein-tyrosine phosphatase
MIDIHNHIIFDFDDGPKKLDESLEMLKIAADQGITEVFATSHFNELIPSNVEDIYFERLNILREKVIEHNIPVNLYSGSEIFFHHLIHETVKKSRVTTLGNQNKYVLMEFPMYLIPNGIEEALYRLSMEGYIPIIAHPERYTSMHSRPEKLLNFIKFGGLLQVNAGSILGEFGKPCQKTAMWLLEQKVVHFIASDAHAPVGRAFKLAKAARALQDNFDQDYIDELVEKNARKIIQNRELEPKQLPEEPQKPKSFFERLKVRFNLL